MSRPEDLLPPELHYNSIESRKYTTSSRIKNIQKEMTLRALELLNLETPSLILDVGCGSGLSGEILSEVDKDEGGPHTWIGMDIAPDMLSIALEKQVDGDLFLADMGQGVPFRAGTFDAVISISAVQWLCNAETSDVSPEGRLKRFFDSLYASVRRGGKAVCQIYPKNKQQRDMIAASAFRAGFAGGYLEDDPDTKNMKLYLVLTAGESSDVTRVVEGMDNVDVIDNRKRAVLKNKAPPKKSKEWIKIKKDKERQKGKIVKADSKYTGRRRKIAF